MEAERETPARRAWRGLARLALWGGLALVALGLAAWPAVVARFHPAVAAGDALPPEALAETGRSRWTLLALGAALAGLGLVLGRRPPARRAWAARALLALGVLAVVPFALDRALAPLVEHPTTIFARDARLGWRLRPGARDHWVGVPVTINAQGMRGPERPEAKPPGTRRLAFLGDSVCFGAWVEDDAAILPAVVERELAADTGAAVECLNFAVGGYSAWQERVVLEERALAFAPDAVVLCFVLNDVVEPLELQRFGGDGEGFQLEHSRAPGLRGLLAGSALAHFARELAARREYGEDVQAGAQRRELLNVYHLLFRPQDPRVRAAWDATLENVRAMAALCRERDLPLLVVLFPYTAQLEDARLDAPQRVLADFCAAEELPLLDLLPPLRAAAEREGIDALFLDALHPTERGHALAGAAVAAEVRALGLLGR